MPVANFHKNHSLKKPLMVIAAIVVVVIGIGAWLKNLGSSQAINNSNLLIDKTLLIKPDSHQLNPGAKVALVEFGDYQCPACAFSYSKVKQIVEKYKDNKDFNFAFRNFPVPGHKFAPAAAEAAEAAGAQGKYWQMNDLLYSKQDDWSNASNPTDLFVYYAQSIGVDLNKFKQDLADNAYAAKIQADQNDGNALGVDATPTFYVGGRKFVGVPDQRILDAIAQDLNNK